MSVSLSEFMELAKEFNVIPMTKTLFAGGETPLATYAKLCKGQPGTFLLESAEHGVWARYSFIGVASRGILSEDSGVATWSGGNTPLPGDKSLPQDPLQALAAMQSSWKSAPLANFPLSSGIVGFVSWRAVSHLERLPDAGPSEYSIPLLGFTQFSQLIVHDHLKHELILVVPAFIETPASAVAEFDRVNRELVELEEALRQPTPSMLDEIDWPEPNATSRTEKSDFLRDIELAKEHVKLGDVFQVVISQRFTVPSRAEAIDVYRAARALNPSPYMFLLNFADSNQTQETWSIVGSSPEALVTVLNNHAVMHPIAGSRPRGQDATTDTELASELLADAKERSEHLMLVDLARNDLLKFCESDSVSVTEFMQVHRFSHVMHLVSTVEGQLRPTSTAVDALRATFPAGTLSGAPKPRALEIIHQLEPVDRGLFGGVVGYFDFHGNADLAIAIRTAVLKDGFAHVQAGAGIVLDSQPESEHHETEVKSAAMLRAVVAANTLLK